MTWLNVNKSCGLGLTHWLPMYDLKLCIHKRKSKIGSIAHRYTYHLSLWIRTDDDIDNKNPKKEEKYVGLSIKLNSVNF